MNCPPRRTEMRPPGRPRASSGEWPEQDGAPALRTALPLVVASSALATGIGNSVRCEARSLVPEPAGARAAASGCRQILSAALARTDMSGIDRWLRGPAFVVRQAIAGSP